MDKKCNGSFLIPRPALLCTTQSIKAKKRQTDRQTESIFLCRCNKITNRQVTILTELFSNACYPFHLSLRVGMSVLQQFLPDVFQFFPFLLSVSLICFHFFLAFIQSSLQCTAPVVNTFHLLHIALKTEDSHMIPINKCWAWSRS